MWCSQCKNELATCICPDIEARLKLLHQPGSRLALRWCTKCDRHQDRCICVPANAREN